MEQPDQIPQASQTSFDKTKLILPVAILVAGILISGSLLYSNTLKLKLGNNTAQIGQGAGNNEIADVKIGDSPILGSKNAKVSIIEFADFRCPFCERFFKDSETQIIKNYVETGKANFVFKHYAFLGQQSTWAGEAAECANEQGKFWEFHNWLYKNQAAESNLAYYSKANLIKYAGKVSLNLNQFSSCLNSDKYADKISSDLTEGQNAGVNGTPTIFINGHKVVGAQPFANFKPLIESELQKAKK